MYTLLGHGTHLVNNKYQFLLIDSFSLILYLLYVGVHNYHLT